ncbi:hypothetical protein ALI144C_30395 [Actinosynnema sp. ALI-1.44]|uniref:AfsR/SARP family transcriptional regulator n=1 Tax=Actinosynnema sp. ALI-1.44 TaxID=1933779 RepID=UPI00097C850F|nr:BTAD domain-containing putative transcriptional regulator [Actinosynnema sp. ALI-1.44]ONI77755.1 hypothetical protein ALI144C_30395 [Actinosynnema sp. ALI-1.44]
MKFEVLGPVAIRTGTGRVAMGGQLRSTLLGVLLARANRPVPVSTLADAMWNDAVDDRTPQKLHLHVHKLRRALDDPDRVSFSAGGYQLRVLPGELDAERFESLADEATALVTADPRRAAELLRDALGLWRTEPYQGLDVPVLAGEARRLNDRRLVAAETLYEAELGCGRHAAIVGELTALVEAHPLRERLHGLLMTALHRCERQADALAVYRKARAVIVDELGVEPGPGLRGIEQRILAGQPLGPLLTAPAQLPHVTGEFTGRAADLSTLDSVAASSPIVAITGTAGVGKTTLAVHWAHRNRDKFPDGQLYVDLRGHGPEKPLPARDVLASLLRTLGVHGAGVPADQDERAARLRTLVDGKRILLVLDNAASADQVRPLLPGSPSCLVLVTSRDTVAGLVARDGAHRVDLDRLTPGEAFDLIRAVAGSRVDAEREATAALAERCARLPLAIRIAAELISTRRGSDVADLVAEQNTLDLLDAGGDPRTAVRAVFSWSYRHLPPDAARLFRLSGVSPDVSLHALAALAGQGVRETQRSLDVLVRANLVEPLPARRFHVHDLLRAYSVELAEPTRSEAVARLLDWYLHMAATAMDLISPHEARPQIPVPVAEAVRLADRHDAVRWLDAERANLVAAAGPDQPAYTARLSPILWRYLENGGYNDEALTLHGLALAEADQRGDRAAAGAALTRLGVAHLRLWHNDIAIDHLTRALRAHESFDDRSALAAVLNNLGLAYALTSRFREAADHYEQALVLRPDRHTAAILTNLGDMYRRLGDHRRAAVLLDEALATANGQIEAFALCHLAALRVDTGHYDEAIALLHKTLIVVKDSGNQLAEGEARYFLGAAFGRLGDHERAFGHYREAWESAVTMGNRQLQAQVSNALAELHHAQGSAAEAVQHHKAACAIATAIGDRYEEARAYAGLGEAERATVIFAELGLPSR